MYTVLLVDDRKRIRDFWKRELERDGYRVLLSGDGCDALDVLMREIPDVIVLDLNMPKVGGNEVIREMRARRIRIPVIVHTASRGPTVEDLRGMVEAFVEKSGDPSALKSAVARAVQPHGGSLEKAE